MAKYSLERKVRVTLIGLLVNAGLSACKIAAGVSGHSHALVADGVESLADIISSLIVWRGVVVAAAPPDEAHPYGHGKAEPLAAAVVATVLLFAAVWISIGAVRDIVRPHNIPASFTLMVLLAVVIIKEILFRYVHREGMKLESSAVSADAWHHRSDAITSLLAFLGISIALWGGKGYEAADDYAALVAAMIIGWNGWRLFRPAMDELMDRSPDPDLAERIRAIAAQTVDVRRIEKCRIRKTGNEYFVDMHIEVNPRMTVEQAHKIAHAVKDNIRLELPAVRDVLVHVEPERPNG